ncbi:MAG: extracellular solute-binding protein [Oscillospiraceae bacterium]|nr:extracellular solute-binding protein [Oscillospiraceae bacterium]MBQ9837544.1 extracellular solute-binding protein [Oscillospiraceae bacterium]
MKKVIALLLALVMVFGLVACGDKAPAADEGTEGVTLNVIAAEYGTETKAWWTGFEADFEAANEGIDLVVDVISWNDIKTVVNTRIANDDAPDILNIDGFASYQDEGLLLPAQDYISEETYAKFYDAFLAESVVDGTVWAVPDLASARAMYYNKDILAAAGVEVPTTWAELRAACEAIKAYDAEIYPWGVDMTTDEGQACFAYYIWNNGGDFIDAEGNWTLNSAENVEAIEYIIGLYNDGLTNTDPANETRYINQDMFGAGKVAMMIGPNSIPTYLTTGGYDVNWGVASIPANEGKASVSAGVMDRFMCFDNGYTEAEMAAIELFFDFFYEDARYSDWVLMEGFLPATSAGGEAMAAADPENAAWIEIVGSAKFYPTAKAEWLEVSQAVIAAQQSALQGGNVQELLDALQADYAG